MTNTGEYYCLFQCEAAVNAEDVLEGGAGTSCHTVRLAGGAVAVHTVVSALTAREFKAYRAAHAEPWLRDHIADLMARQAGGRLSGPLTHRTTNGGVLTATDVADLATAATEVASRLNVGRSSYSHAGVLVGAAG